MTARRSPRLLLVALAALLLAIPFVQPRAAAAHPLGNFTINRYARIEVFGDALRLYYVLDFAEIPTFQLKERIDSDGDGALSQAEVDAYVDEAREALPGGFDLTVDGQPVDLQPVEQSGQALPGAADLETLRVVVVYQAAVSGDGRVTITFEDRNYADRAGWKEVVIGPSSGALVQADAALLRDRSNALLDYPAESLNSAPNVSSAAFTWQAGTGTPAPAGATIEAASAKDGAGGFASLLENRRSAGIIFLSFLAALGFGALHALGPGHGKTVVAAYLVGSRGTVRHAFALGLTVTATHTATVYLLGFVTLVASAFIVPERLYLYLGVASGALVLVMGLALLAGRIRTARCPAAGAHRHGFLGRAHSHAHAHDEHSREIADGVPDHDGHDHAPSRVTWRGLVTLGVAGGMIPCPSAIVVMLAAISLGQAVFGMLLIVAFSFGLAGVLTAIGVALVLGRRFSGRVGAARMIERPAVARLVRALPVLSAVGVTIAGALITYQAWTQPL